MIPEGSHKDQEFCFMLITPAKQSVLAAESRSSTQVSACLPHYPAPILMDGRTPRTTYMLRHELLMWCVRDSSERLGSRLNGTTMTIIMAPTLMIPLLERHCNCHDTRW